MANPQIVLAEQYARKYHDGQFRKGSNLPYVVHPIAVAETLARFGYDDPVTQCIALLHDTVEDSKLSMDEIQEVFGYEISNGVYILSRNKGKMREGELLTPEGYIDRLSWARNKIKRVKISDMIHNTQDLEALSDEGIDKKVADAEKVYIPWGREIAPIMVGELEANITNFRRKSAQQRR
jgi:GTP diphosphokinase / guanosine-3',5'-bis(diphosphate) 3'-diphosphatase